MSEHARCPFCGSADSKVGVDEDTMFISVVCCGCFAAGPPVKFHNAPEAPEWQRGVGALFKPDAEAVARARWDRRVGVQQ
jgi:hypothetical protein